MKRTMQIISLAALCLTIFPSALFYAGRMELDTVKSLMLWATAAWFIVTPFWMGREAENPQPREHRSCE